MTGRDRAFDLVETMRFDPHDGIYELERHLVRLKDSAVMLGFAFDRHDARNDLHAATFRAVGPSLVRLRVARGGSRAVELAPLPAKPREPVEVSIRPLPGAPDDARLRHRTSDRAFQDHVLAGSGTFEVLFLATDGSLMTGSFTTPFLRRDDGLLLTPPLPEGTVHGGVLRGALIEAGEAIEAPLAPADLAGGFLIGNAWLGLIEARLALTVAAGGTTSL